MPPYHRTTDVLVVGSGAAGLIASLAARHHNLRTIVVEGSDKLGGASACSSGALWVPGNPVSQAAGVADSFERALQYMEAVIDDVGPASSRARKEAFLRGGPQMVAFLAELGFQWRASLGYADAYPDQPGGTTAGRAIEGEVFNLRKLGAWRQHLRLGPIHPSLPLYASELGQAALVTRTLRGFLTAVRALGLRSLGRRMLGQLPATCGGSLIGQLLYLAQQHTIEIWRASPFVRLIVEAGRVVGAVVRRDGQEQRILAERGVLLAAGGFAKNLEMRRRYQQEPIGVDWTTVPPHDQGEAVRAGMEIGAATAMLDDAWWCPTFRDPVSGKSTFALWERSLPHAIIVDSAGERFMNESEPSVDAGHHQYERHRLRPAIPAWLILDARHRRRYPLATLPPGITPASALDSGFLTKARSLEELAGKIGVEGEGLARTVARFNAMARRGTDEDYGRGDSAADRLYSDPRCAPNPNLGPLEKAPFYAARIWPGDLGTKGGLLTDEHARVLHTDGSVIAGLYATGNTTASVMGRTSPGPGSSLGPATTFAYLAVQAMAQAADTAVLEPGVLAEELERARARRKAPAA